MSIILSFGRFGGFSVARGYTFRICFGWVSLIVMPLDVDLLLCQCSEKIRQLENELKMERFKP